MPGVNYNDLQAMLFSAWIRKPTGLSGTEIRLLRHHLKMTYGSIAQLLKVERSLVSKWVRKDLKATGMTIHAENYLRIKLAKLNHQNLNQEFDTIEPGAAAKGAGEPLKINLSKAR